jgi:hypothetical protein
MDLQNTDQFLTTREAAGLLDLQPETLRTYLAKTGSVLGIEPERGDNGRLLWPVSKVLRTRDARRA